MLFTLYEKAVAYFSQHPTLNASAHFAAGFGLALVLQHYLKGNAILPVWFGWLLIIFSAVIHFMAFR